LKLQRPLLAIGEEKLFRKRLFSRAGGKEEGVSFCARGIRGRKKNILACEEEKKETPLPAPARKFLSEIKGVLQQDVNFQKADVRRFQEGKKGKGAVVSFG